MTESSDKRGAADRRRQPRGGRRPADRSGYTPLVFVIDPRPSAREACEAILAKLRFAVAPFDSLDQAKRALNGLKPDILLLVTEHLDEKRLFHDDKAVAREEVGTHDDVGDPGFVLEREEDEAFGGAWPLPRNDHPRHAHAPALTRRPQIGRPENATHRQLVAPQRHRM